MKSLMAVFGISVLVAIVFTGGAQAQLPIVSDLLNDVVGTAGGAVDGAASALTGAVNTLTGNVAQLGQAKSLLTGNNSAQAQILGELTNQTAELVVHTVTVTGIIIASVQQILDGICDLLFKLYDGFVYPILDCLFAIMGLSDAICAISEQPCIEDLLYELSQENCSELAGVVPRSQQDGLVGAENSEEEGGEQGGEEGGDEGASRRKRQAPLLPPPPPPSKANVTVVIEVSRVNKFLEKFTGEDRKYAVYTLRLVALVIQITIFFSVHLHLLPIVLCVEQRERYGYDQADQACRLASKGKPDGKSGAAPGGAPGGGGGLGNLLGGLTGGGGKGGGLIGGILGGLGGK